MPPQTTPRLCLLVASTSRPLMLAWGWGVPSLGPAHAEERGLSRLLLGASSFAAHLTPCPTPRAPSPPGRPGLPCTRACVFEPCTAQRHSPDPSRTPAPQTRAPNPWAQGSPGDGPLAICTAGGRQVSLTTPRLLCGALDAPLPAPWAPASCGHPCPMPSRIPGLRHTSRRWSALRTPMSLGSVSPPPGLGFPGGRWWWWVCGDGWRGGAEGPDTARGGRNVQ